ncbi:hypothetical protein GCM10010885_19130 [Alicyclobacillus cellulosilyticus]|uniref:Phage shock protein A (PspA) family protein n=1 Tax=Alicyclobacillus cellulosilyticus TaxID=1003997 RepID=A0A917KFD3_9BACL|nr:PspA/IM30 family protein [Alicyclobacillus cellulosilyticus]GGJ10141.1 hypothetical protein GCM10010885_19130 [Alicyclobacillus cellulosilyticus]
MGWLNRMRSVWAMRRAQPDRRAEGAADRVQETLAQWETQWMRLEAACAEYAATAQRLRQMADDARERARRRQQDAATALAFGDEVRARAAVAEAVAEEQRAHTLSDEAAAAEARLHALRQDVERLRTELLSHRETVSQWSARAEAARLDTALADLASGIDPRARDFARLAAEVARLEAEAAAHREVAERACATSSPDTTGQGQDDPADTEERSKDEVERRLADLRQQLGL